MRTAEKTINILQVASKQPQTFKKQFCHWAGKLQFCLHFDQIEANLCPKKDNIGPNPIKKRHH
jgi:hypothetical protein